MQSLSHARFLNHKGWEREDQPWLSYYSVTHHTGNPAWAFVKLRELSLLDNIFLSFFLFFFVRGLDHGKFPPFLPLFLALLHTTWSLFSFFKEGQKKKKKVGSLLLVENKLAAALPRRHSDNQAEKAL